MLAQQNAADQYQDRVVQMKENKGEEKPADWMLHVDARTERGCRETDHGLGNSVHSERSMPEAVLSQAYGHPKQKTGGGISPAQSEIDRYQERQFQDGCRAEIRRQHSLERQGQHGDAKNGAGVDIYEPLYAGRMLD